MKVTTRITWDMATGRVIEHEYFDYPNDAPVALAKKGRQQVEHAANAQNQIGDEARPLIGAYKDIQSGYRGASDAGTKNYFGPPGANGLGKWTNTQYENDKRNIEQTSKDALEVGQRMLAHRGLNASPGAMSSLINTTNRNRDAQITDAYNTAVNRQLGLGLEGVKYNTGMQEMYNPLRAIGTVTGVYQGGADAGAKRGQMGSWLGDIGAGLSGVSSLLTPFGGGL